MNTNAAKVAALVIGLVVIGFAGYAIVRAAQNVAESIKPVDPWAEANK